MNNRYINSKFNFMKKDATDDLFVDYHSVLPVFAKKGDLVVSNQSGSHRGFPQSPGFKRIMLVVRYY